VSRLASIVLLVTVIVFSYFSIYNQEVVTLKLWKGQTVDLHVFVVVLISAGLGAAVVFLLFGLRGIRRTYDQIQVGIVKRRRQKAEELYNRGVDAHLSGKMEKAVKLLEGAVTKDPEFLLPFFRLGTVYLELGREKKALELHRKALEAHPDNLRIQLFLVDDYLATGELDDAINILKRIISSDDSNLAALQTLRNIQEQKGDWRGAVETQSRLMKISGKEDESLQRLRSFRYQWALDLLAQGERDKGVKTLKEILKEDPEYLAAVVTLGESYMKSGKVEEGIKVLSEGYRRHQNPVFLQVMEEKLIKHDNPSRLVEMFRKLLDQSPEDVLLNLFYGKICLRLEMIDDGYMALSKVESTGYESAYLHALLGEINARRERNEEAIEEYRRYVELSDGLSPRFVCGNCGHITEKWNARCESCGLWNSYELPGLAEPVHTPAVRPQYDGQGYEE
jgi:lipopolysaccharide biosynthesis regulator YciM